MAESEVLRIRPAGDEHQIVTLRGGRGTYRRRPCGDSESIPERPGCPWRIAGHFPPEAFAHSASTAEDLSVHTFGCHEATPAAPAICAGFLLSGGHHNMAVRMRSARGDIDFSQITDGGYELHAGYVSMAMANGVDPSDPALAQCRLSPDEEIICG